MDRVGSRQLYSFAAAPLSAALGCLQPGIDPIFLSLLSHSSQLPLAAHGMIVGGTQAGAALGSLAVWRLGLLLPRGAIIVAATIALACSMVTPVLDDLIAILPVRCCYGLAMGIVYAYSMAAYAAHNPTRAFGAVFLIQLIVSTVVSLVLPELEHAAGAGVALAALALAPATAFAALLLMPTRPHATVPRTAAADHRVVPTAGWAFAAATFWFICATMLIWSFSAGLATNAGLANRTIAHAVAIGSMCGALTALVVMRKKMLVPLPLTALLASGALIAPIVLTAPGADTAFILSIILLNIGSTAIIIRCSGLAAGTTGSARFRAFVACTHSLGLIAGPLLGSAMLSFGNAGLLARLLLALSAGLAAVIWACIAAPTADSAIAAERIAGGTEMALD